MARTSAELRPPEGSRMATRMRGSRRTWCAGGPPDGAHGQGAGCLRLLRGLADVLRELLHDLVGLLLDDGLAELADAPADLRIGADLQVRLRVSHGCELHVHGGVHHAAHLAV